MRLSDFKGEEALDVLADIIEPLTTILTSERVQELAKQEAPTLSYVAPILKQKKEIVAILARLDNKPVDEYMKTLNLVTLPKQILELINDPEVQSLFHSQTQTQTTSEASFGSAMGNIEAKKN